MHIKCCHLLVAAARGSLIPDSLQKLIASREHFEVVMRTFEISVFICVYDAKNVESYEKISVRLPVWSSVL